VQRYAAAVAKLLDEGCGFGNDDWFENGEAEAQAQEDAGVVLNFCSVEVEEGLALELQAKISDERDCQAEMESCARDLRAARTAHKNTVDDARIAAEMLVEVQNKLWIVRQKRRLDRAESE